MILTPDEFFEIIKNKVTHHNYTNVMTPYRQLYDEYSKLLRQIQIMDKYSRVKAIRITDEESK